MVKSKFVEQSTSFHGLSRNFEFKMVTSLAGRRVNSHEIKCNRIRRPATFEKANCLHQEVCSEITEGKSAERLLTEPIWTFGTRKHLLVKDVLLQQKESAFTEVRRPVEKAREAEQGTRKAGLDKAAVQCPPSSSFSFVRPNGMAGEPKSAFSKPVKCWEDGGAPATFQPLKGIKEGSPRTLSECIRATDLMPYSGCFASGLLLSGLDGFRLLSTNIIQSNPFASSSAPWPKEVGEQTQATPASSCSSSLALLPPTFTPFHVAAQNWCAKCSLSFHMTSDLVLHMRSHHKKVRVSTESHRKRKREEKLTCPVCREYFRERHHLSRHMTSHN